MILEKLSGDFAVCKLPLETPARGQGPLTFVAYTDEESSWVGPVADIPPQSLAVERGFRGFRVKGPLDFSLIGILSAIAQCLAERHISIFVISTFDTDYVWVREAQWQEAEQILEQAGYEWQ